MPIILSGRLRRAPLFCARQERRREVDRQVPGSSCIGPILQMAGGKTYRLNSGERDDEPERLLLRDDLLTS